LYITTTNDQEQEEVLDITDEQSGEVREEISATGAESSPLA
jgi:hypothetical protein